MGKKGNKAKVTEIVKERDCEDWCFVCKDGGELILCDFDDCLKVYHPECVKKGDSSSECGQQWICDRHSCSECHRAPQFYCYSCPIAVCRLCIKAAQFLPVGGKQGLCCECLELAEFVEEKRDGVDTDGGVMDLKDRDTYECLFLEYWDIVKEKEDLMWDDVILAQCRLKKHSRHSLKSKKIGRGEEDSEFVTYDRNLDNAEGEKVAGKKKKLKALEYDGWGSKQLIEFLRFLGKDTTEELSQSEVNSIIHAYIREKELLDPNKKRKVLCDERLYSVFKRKSMLKNAIYSLLEVHFRANLVFSESEEDGEDENMDKVESSLLDENGKCTATFKRQKTMGCRTKPEEQEAVPKLCESGFASIVAENIELVYLRRSLVEELLKDPESFEGKIVGSFVKVKNDPRDPTARHSYQLSQVAVIKQNSVIGETKSEILLRVSTMPMDVSFSRLADSDYNEEDIEDLRQKVEEGLHPKPTVVELEQKAKQLHVERTKHWIEKELIRLQKCIDFTNEKGWRREKYEYLEQRELLKKPSEQEWLLQQSPRVIPEMIECKTV